MMAMIKTQQELFANEDKILAPYALKSAHSRGRKYHEPEDPHRTAFQRDRDRVIHSKAFRRLSGKTQVFVSSYGDHYRSRLTHSLEVAQVSRDIARALGLNEDLCETIALAHDLGHTPFGHAGEEAMSEMMIKCGDTFEHNDQSKRVVELLEKKSEEFSGLNLSWEVIEGLMKHRKFHDDGKILVIHSLESQVVDLADAIAYHHHDLDDGLRSGVLKLEELAESIPIWSQVSEDLSFSSLGEELFRHIAITRLMSLLIDDVLTQSQVNITTLGLVSPLMKPSYGSVIGFSSRMQPRVDQLSEFLGKKFYLHQRVSTQAHHGQKIIKTLFEAYSADEKLLPLSIRAEFEHEKRQVVIKDYIAGMTDHYARARFEEYK
jgi:dGTPase